MCLLGINFTAIEKMSGGKKKKKLKGNEIQYSLEKQLK